MKKELIKENNIFIVFTPMSGMDLFDVRSMTLEEAEYWIGRINNYLWYMRRWLRRME